ncbi:hypothetical protein DL765_005480 [Monosporascus sp. GIB2]|nr:hypothetical protein DL765_005480 [Monosporascus sp. GIB2]
MPVLGRIGLARQPLRGHTRLIASRGRPCLSCHFASCPVRFSRSYASASGPREHLIYQPSLLRRTAKAVVTGAVFLSIGFAMAAAPAVPALNGLLSPPTNEETLGMFTPQYEDEGEIDDFIRHHPLTIEMRSRPGYSESRPHLKLPPSFRNHNLTGGTLMGSGKVTVPPVVFTEEAGRSLVSISYLGNELCGHPGIVHGGLLATLLDEGLARCCFAALPHSVGMTAKLIIHYRNPTPAGSYVVLRATTTKVEGRKAWVEGHIETLVGKGETPVVLADATALFVSPRQAALMTNIYPTR